MTHTRFPNLTVIEPGVVKFERVGDGASRLVYVLVKDVPARIKTAERSPDK